MYEISKYTQDYKNDPTTECFNIKDAIYEAKEWIKNSGGFSIIQNKKEGIKFTMGLKQKNETNFLFK